MLSFMDMSFGCEFEIERRLEEEMDDLKDMVAYFFGVRYISR